MQNFHKINAKALTGKVPNPSILAGTAVNKKDF